MLSSIIGKAACLRESHPFCERAQEYSSQVQEGWQAQLRGPSAGRQAKLWHSMSSEQMRMQMLRSGQDHEEPSG